MEGRRWAVVAALALAAGVVVLAVWTQGGMRGEERAGAPRAAAASAPAVGEGGADRLARAALRVAVPKIAGHEAVARYEAGNRVAAYVREAQQRSDAQSQVDVALLQWLARPPSATNPAALAGARDRAIAAAAAADPNERWAAWLEAAICTDPSRCDAAAARARMQALDPDDANVWLLESFDASPASQQRLDAALARAAQAPGFEDAFDAFAARADEALQRAGWPPPPPEVAGLVAEAWGMRGNAPPSAAAIRRGEALVIASGLAFPGWHRWYAGCRPPQSAHRTDACRAVLTAMARGGNLQYVSLGTSRMRELAAGTQEHAYWREQYRRQRWRVEQQSHVAGDPRFMELRLAMGEVEAIDALLRLQGRGMPPAGWMPPGDHARRGPGRPPGG